jgi:fibronectin type 3 domain-containing protein
VSQLISGIGCVVVMIRRFPVLHLEREDRAFSPKLAKSMLGTGLPMGLQFSITAIGSVLVQWSVNGLGVNAVAAVSGAVKLSWQAVPGAAKYQIYRSVTGKSGSFKLVKTTTSTSWRNAKAGAGKTFYYKVRAVSESGLKSAFSKVVTLTAKPAAPKANGTVTAKGKPTMSWQAVTGAVKYQVYRSTTGKSGSFKLLKTVTGLKATNTKAVAGKTYYYKVRAVAADGTKGAFSSVMKLRAGKPAITTQPKTITAAKGDTAVFAVKAAGTGLSYQWQFRTSPTGKWKDCTSKTEGYRSATLKVKANSK